MLHLATHTNDVPVFSSAAFTSPRFQSPMCACAEEATMVTQLA